MTREEIANTVTHAIGLLLAIAGLSVLVVFAALRGSAWHVVSSSVYGATLVMLYAASTIYHFVRAPRYKNKLRVLDHASIYLLIAGTYTPFMLVNLRGGWGWSIFGVVWGLAVAGVIFKLFTTGRFAGVSTALYLMMGWLVVIAAVPMIARVPTAGLIWLLIGGVSYSFGTYFFMRDHRPFHHAIWHLFVLGGSVCHWFAVSSAIL